MSDVPGTGLDERNGRRRPPVAGVDLLPQGVRRDGPRPAPRRPAPTAGGQGPLLRPWLAAQSVNVVRHAAALRPFADGEFGTGAAAPSRGHVGAVNELIVRLREHLIRRTRRVTDAGTEAGRRPDEA